MYALCMLPARCHSTSGLKQPSTIGFKGFRVQGSHLQKNFDFQYTTLAPNKGAAGGILTCEPYLMAIG